MCLGTRESEVFPITVFGEVTERQPQSGGYGKFSNAPGLCSEITTNTEHLCMYLGVTNFSRVYRNVRNQKKKYMLTLNFK